jgi:hypothetical protein
MLGHKNYRTTQRYSHIADTALREAVNRTAKTIIRAGQGRAAWNKKGSPGPRAGPSSRRPRRPLRRPRILDLSSKTTIRPVSRGAGDGAAPRSGLVTPASRRGRCRGVGRGAAALRAVAAAAGL